MSGCRSTLGIAVIALVGFALAGCSSSSKPNGEKTTTTTAAAGTTTTLERVVPKVGAVPWPAPADAMARTRAAGLVPRGFETHQHHVHSHLDIYIDRVHEVVPAGIGI